VPGKIKLASTWQPHLRVLEMHLNPATSFCSVLQTIRQLSAQFLVKTDDPFQRYEASQPLCPNSARRRQSYFRVGDTSREVEPRVSDVTLFICRDNLHPKVGRVQLLKDMENQFDNFCAYIEKMKLHYACVRRSNQIKKTLNLFQNGGTDCPPVAKLPRHSWC
jgi:hypothetical protein